MSLNRVSLSGNLTRNSELRYTQGGSAVLSFAIAVNERHKNAATGEWESRPNFVDCSMFGNRAQALAQYLTKGAKVALEGRLHYSSWTKDDERRSKLEVIVDEVEFMSRADGGQAQAPAAAPAPVSQAAPAAAYAGGQPATLGGYAGEVYDEDIPF